MNISPSVLRDIHEHLEATYPDEGCGFLVGDHRDDAIVVRAAHAVSNGRAGHAAARRYLITPEDYRAAEAQARTAGHIVIGTYHSHPDVPAQPSDYDRDHAWPWYRYLIVSVRGGRVAEQRAWELREDRSGFIEHQLIEGT
jgi:proteasome lid subunit RPN8/RPN11